MATLILAILVVWRGGMASYGFFSVSGRECLDLKVVVSLDLLIYVGQMTENISGRVLAAGQQIFQNCHIQKIVEFSKPPHFIDLRKTSEL